MRETRTRLGTAVALALLATTGCYDFDKAFQDCVAAGRCVATQCDPSLPDVPDDAFFDANCDGVDGVATAGLFVDPVAGSDINDGTREAPFKTLSVALKRAAAAGKVLYLAQGTYPEPDLKVDSRVSLYGGYAGMAGGWARGNSYSTFIDGGVIGLTVSGLGDDAGTVIERLTIASAPATDAGTPSIGVRVLNSNGVRLRYVQVETGKGADGLPGASPSAPLTGAADGGVGQPGSTNSGAPGPTGGSPGLGNCGTVPPTGGRGGTGSNSNASQATAGDPGTPTAAGGPPGRQDSTSCVCTTTCVCTGNDGGTGTDGLDGSVGSNGPPGEATGQLSGDTWTPTFGGKGEPGTPGGGGGGGGGGSFAGNSYAVSSGGGGGGGGAGGCPGAVGEGGQGGGASIAVLLIHSQVALESTRLHTQGGGKGGNGGTGAPGGPGGRGGPGGVAPTSINDSVPIPVTATGGNGGAGGNGGTGGRGGHGGNGGGGPSVGIWYDTTSSVTEQNTVFALDSPGAPGAGPSSAGNPGIKEEHHQSAPPP